MTTTIAGHQAKERFVGLDLQDNEDSRAIVRAIVRDNPDTKVSQMPGLVKLQAPRQLDIKRESIEKELRREWETQEFNLNIISYIGDIQDWDDDHILVKWNTD